MALLPNLETLTMTDNAISGTLPAQWAAGFVNLQGLGMKVNRISGTLPPQWAKLRISHLALGSNSLSGSLPAAWGDMRCVRHLHAAALDRAH